MRVEPQLQRQANRRQTLKRLYGILQQSKDKTEPTCTICFRFDSLFHYLPHFSSLPVSRYSSPLILVIIVLEPSGKDKDIGRKKHSFQWFPPLKLLMVLVNKVKVGKIKTSILAEGIF